MEPGPCNVLRLASVRAAPRRALMGDKPFATIIPYGRRCPAFGLVRDHFVDLTNLTRVPADCDSWLVSLGCEADYIRSEKKTYPRSVVVRVLFRGTEQPERTEYDHWIDYADRHGDVDVRRADFVDIDLDMAKEGKRNVVQDAFDECARRLSAQAPQPARASGRIGWSGMTEDEEEVFAPCRMEAVMGKQQKRR